MDYNNQVRVCFSRNLNYACQAFDATAINRVYNFSILHAPRYLYRYRSFKNDYSLRGIENESISFSAVKEFKDPFDTFAAIPSPIDAVRQVSSAAERVDSEDFRKLISRIGPAGIDCSHLTPLSFSVSPNMDLASRLKRATAEAAHKARETNIQEELKNVKILCLTENANSKRMWKEYAEDGEGYVIEYSADEVMSIGGEEGLITRLYPVIYTDVPHNSLVFALSILLVNLGARIAPYSQAQSAQLANYVAILCSKHTQWNFEKEWRATLVTKGDEKTQSFVSRHCRANAVIPGPKISSANRDKLIRACQVHDVNIKLELT